MKEVIYKNYKEFIADDGAYFTQSTLGKNEYRMYWKSKTVTNDEQLSNYRDATESEKVDYDNNIDLLETINEDNDSQDSAEKDEALRILGIEL